MQIQINSVANNIIIRSQMNTCNLQLPEISFDMPITDLIIFPSTYTDGTDKGNSEY